MLQYTPAALTPNPLPEGEGELVKKILYTAAAPPTISEISCVIAA